MATGRRVLAAGVLLLAVCTLGAHELGQSESVFEARGAAVVATVTVDLLEFPGVDDDRNGRVSYDELDAAIADVFAQLKAHLRVQAHVPPARVTLDQHDIVEDEHVLRLQVSYAFPEPVPAITVTSSLDLLGSPAHQHLVTAVVDGERRRAVLDRANPSVTVPLRAERFTVARVLAAIVGLVAVGGLIWLRTRRR
jgi:hypothetical protein